MKVTAKGDMECRSDCVDWQCVQSILEDEDSPALYYTNTTCTRIYESITVSSKLWQCICFLSWTKLM